MLKFLRKTAEHLELLYLLIPFLRSQLWLSLVIKVREYCCWSLYPSLLCNPQRYGHYGLTLSGATSIRRTLPAPRRSRQGHFSHTSVSPRHRDGLSR